jgi:hypothetical protein
MRQIKCPRPINVCGQQISSNKLNVIEDCEQKLKTNETMIDLVSQMI